MAGPAFDIIPDGSPPETPELAAAPAYENVPPIGRPTYGFGEIGQAVAPELMGTVKLIGRVGAQGMFAGSSYVEQGIYGMGATAGEGFGIPDVIPPPGSVVRPILSPQEGQARYAPTGNDGKPVSLGDSPMPDEVFRLMGDEKRDEIERENVMARFQNAHSWPTNFAAGMVGFMLDPLRAATAFVPAIGEEAILARLGTGLAASIAARVGAGAITGAVSQAPVAALEYGLGTQEASDYGLRDAFRDMAFAAAGNALFHTGLATAGELYRGDPLFRQDATTNHAAISAAVGEMVEGKPTEVTPIFQPRTPEDVEALTKEGQGPIRTLSFLPPTARPMRASDMGPIVPADLAAQQRELYDGGFAPGVRTEDLRATTREVYGPPEPAAAEPGGAPAQPAGTPLPAVPEPQEPRAAGAEVPHETPITLARPREPDRLINYLRSQGGVKDEGGDVRQSIGGARGRPGLINNATGLPLDEAALRAWQAGFLPDQARPDINALLDAIDEDHKGVPRYSQQDENAVNDYREALARNDEIDRISGETGIEWRGKTPGQFWGEVSDHLSQEDAARMAREMADAHEASYAEFEARAKSWMEENGKEPNTESVYQRGEPRTLADAEREWGEAEAATAVGEREGGAVGPRLAGRPEGAGEAGEGPGGGGAGAGGRAVTEMTAQGEQRIMPGMERSAAQAAAQREAAGRGMVRPRAEQQAPGGLFAEPEMAAAQLDFDRLSATLDPEDRIELDQARADVASADAMTKPEALAAAIACLKDAGA